MPFPFVFAVAALGGIGQAILSGSAANQNNQRARSAARSGQEAINAELVQTRLAALDRASMLGQESQSRIGAILNRYQGQTGQARRLLLGQVYRDASIDQQNINQSMAYSEKAAAANKENVRRGAASQMQSVGLAALSGGIQGAQSGAALGSSLQSLSNANKLQAALKNPNLTPAQTQALLAGVSPENLSNPAIMNYYQTQQSLQELALQSARAERNAALANFGYSLFGLRSTR